MSAEKFFFDKHRFNRYLADNPRARSAIFRLIPPCELLVMLNLVRHSIKYGRRARTDMERAELIKQGKLSRAIDGLEVAEEIISKHGKQEQTTELAVLRECKVGFRKILDRIQSDPDCRPKALGSSNGKPSPVYLVYLQEYITSKIGRKSQPSETAYMLSALLAGFDQSPTKKGAIVADTLAKRLREFESRNPGRMEEIKRKTACDPSGKNELDRDPRLSRPAKKDRL